MSSITASLENENSEQWLDLINQAKIAYERAYAPYSEFNVGAAALTTQGKVALGCNVENASYGLTICAERSCIAHGVINHRDNSELRFVAIVIFTKQTKLTPPCGACRQTLVEFFSPDGKVMSVNHLGEQKIWTVEQLLPDAFIPSDLLHKD